MNRTRVLILAVAAILGSVAFVWPATATEQAGAYRQRAAQDFNGMKGRQAIRTNPATVFNVGYVHFNQIDTGAQGGDFIAIGTAKGLGVDQCPDRYSGSWSIYTDGMIAGVYFCREQDDDAYQAKTNPAFSITYEYCPLVNSSRWVMSFGGTVWECIAATSNSGSRVAAALETTGPSTVDRNIDVKFNSVKTRHAGGSWVDFAAPGTHVVDPSYSVDTPFDGQINSYLAPLD